jgi:rod shape-determining protein MreC
MLLLRWIYAMVVRGRGAVSLLVLMLFSLWLTHFEPIQREHIRRGMLTTILLPIHSVVSAFRLRTDMAATITRLQQEKTVLLTRGADLRDIGAENQRLRKMLGLAPRIPYPLMAADVLSRQSVRPLGSWVVDRGHESGIEEGMAVLAPDGLVGRVIEAGYGYSLVQVITDPDCRVAVINLRSRHPGTLYSPDGLRVEVESNVNADYKAGDTLVTWGAGGVFPKGLPVGLVISADAHAVGVLRQCLVRPFQDPDQVENVFLVLRRASTQVGSDQLVANGFEVVSSDSSAKDTSHSHRDTLR